MGLKTIATTKKYLIINQQINAPSVVVIDEAGKQLGEMATSQALEEAKQRGYDLALVAEQANPPVAKFINYGQFKYNQKKLAAKQKKGIIKTSTKSIRLTFKMAEHDITTRQKQAEKFLDKGHKIKADMRLRGRENAHIKLAIDKLNEFRQTLKVETVVEQHPKRQGGVFSMIFRKA